MQLAYRLLVVGLFLCAPFASAQDNPNLDTPPMQQQFGPTPTPLGVNVITTPDGFDNFDLGVNNAEPHISSNPLNPRWFFSAYNTNSAYRSTDGNSWTASSPNFGTGITVRGDPVTAYDSLGNLYYETMFGATIVGCKVMRSTDGGATWSPSVTAIDGVDKNWIACDQTMGPYANYVYTVMTRSGGGNFARSTDFGATWTNTFAPTTQSLPGMMVAVGPNVLGGNNISGGCVYVVTNSGTNGASTYTFYRSTDGGATFSLMSTQQFSNYIGTEVGGRSTVVNMRTRPYPMIAADNSFGVNRGRLYLVYASNNPSGNGNKSDIFLRTSTDHGATWSAARVVNDDPNSQNNFQFFPAIWCDKETGRLYIKWYDTRLVPTSDSMDVYATYTDDGGQTFAANQRLTNRTFRISLGGAAPAYQGDYDAITSNQVASLACWTDFRNGNYLGMTAYFPDFAMLARATRDTLKFTDSTTAVIRVPAVKLYTNRVKFTATVSPAAPFVFTWQNGRDSLTAYPDSVTLRIRTNNVPEGNYVVTVTGQGPNGTPVHRRTIPIRVQLIPNTITILQPNGGEIWVQAQSKQIRWRNTGDVNNVRVDYSTNNGTSWAVVNASVPAVSGSFNWTVPSTVTSQARVRLAWLDSVTTVLDQSDSLFRIAAPTALIATAPESLRAVLQIGNQGFDTLRIANTGTVTLSWSTTGPTWGNAFPTTGTVPADSTRRAPVRFNATGLIGGTYFGDLVVASNDVFRPQARVPMRLTVVGVAQIVATPRDTLRFGAVRFGRSDTLAVRIRNTGTDTLRTRSSILPIGRFIPLTPVANLAPNDSTTLRVAFTPLDSTSSYTASLRIANNDPDPADDTVFVVLTGRGAGATSVSLSSSNFVPENYALEQNYPNPFNPTTNIRFGIPANVGANDATTLQIFDMLGREVATLVNEKLTAGTYTATFETTGLSSGVYLYRLAAGKFVDVKKMILAK